MSLPGKYFEVNFDGLVGPTHNYAGLGYGNFASIKNRGLISSPKQAALQGLNKMQLMIDLGLTQAIIPPHPNPNIPYLKSLGFTGNIYKIIQDAYKHNIDNLITASSSSGMWVANMATVSNPLNTSDNKLHIATANLASNPHRKLESKFNFEILKKIFNDPKYFYVHQSLPNLPGLTDEGAANHSILSNDYNQPGVEIFCYGVDHIHDRIENNKYIGRQSLQASQEISKLNNLNQNNTAFVKQSQFAIDNGVFHNDLICVINKNVVLFHEHSFEDSNSFEKLLSTKFMNKICFIKIQESKISLSKSVKSYLFNSQLISLDENNMSLISPIESKNMPESFAVIKHIIQDKYNPINAVNFVNCSDSMLNGGGPACLRLRVVMNQDMLNSISKSVPNIILNNTLIQEIKELINKYYLDTFTIQDLLSKEVINNNLEFYDRLTELLGFGSIYWFQKK